jgi:hypothetical protein
MHRTMDREFTWKSASCVGWEQDLIECYLGGLPGLDSHYLCGVT